MDNNLKRYQWQSPVKDRWFLIDFHTGMIVDEIWYEDIIYQTNYGRFLTLDDAKSFVDEQWGQ